MGQVKKRWKLYKSGKRWLVTTLTFGGLLVTTAIDSNHVHAATISDADKTSSSVLSNTTGSQASLMLTVKANNSAASIHASQATLHVVSAATSNASAAATTAKTSSVKPASNANVASATAKTSSVKPASNANAASATAKTTSVAPTVKTSSVKPASNASVASVAPTAKTTNVKPASNTAVKPVSAAKVVAASNATKPTSTVAKATPVSAVNNNNKQTAKVTKLATKQPMVNAAITPAASASAVNSQLASANSAANSQLAKAVSTASATGVNVSQAPTQTVPTMSAATSDAVRQASAMNSAASEQQSLNASYQSASTAVAASNASLATSFSQACSAYSQASTAYSEQSSEYDAWHDSNPYEANKVPNVVTNQDGTPSWKFNNGLVFDTNNQQACSKMDVSVSGFNGDTVHKVNIADGGANRYEYQVTLPGDGNANSNIGSFTFTNVPAFLDGQQLSKVVVSVVGVKHDDNIWHQPSQISFSNDLFNGVSAAKCSVDLQFQFYNADGQLVDLTGKDAYLFIASINSWWGTTNGHPNVSNGSDSSPADGSSTQPSKHVEYVKVISGGHIYQLPGSTVTVHNGNMAYSDDTNGDTISGKYSANGKPITWEGTGPQSCIGGCVVGLSGTAPVLEFGSMSDENDGIAGIWAPLSTTIPASNPGHFDGSVPHAVTYLPNPTLKHVTASYHDDKVADDTITVHYITSDGKALANSTTITQAGGTAYTTAPVSVTGWHVISTNGLPTSGTMPVNGGNVNYVYGQNAAKVDIQVIDDTTGKTLDNVTVNGLYGQSSSQAALTNQTDLNNLLNNGYKLVKNDIPDQVTFGSTVPTYQIHVDEGTVTITPSNPQVPGSKINPNGNSNGPTYPASTAKDQLTKTVDRTITYHFTDNSQPDKTVTQSDTFQRKIVINKVTGKVISDTWSPAQSFNNVPTPSVTGYTPSTNDVPAMSVNNTTPDSHVTVNYTPDKESATITYTDQTTGKVIKTTSLSGNYGTSVTPDTPNVIKQLEQDGYEPVSDNVPSTIKYNTTTPQHYQVVVKEGTVTVTPSNPQTAGSKIDPQDSDSPVYPDSVNHVQQTVTRTINYRYSNGQTAKPSVTQSDTFQRKIVINKVTGKVISDSWTPTSDTMPSVTSPSITGYTPSVSSVPSTTVNNSSADSTTTVTYTPQTEQITINYIDKSDNNKLLQQQQLHGAYGSSAANTTQQVIASLEKQGYVLDSDDVPSKLQFNQTKPQVYNVVVSDGTVTITASNPQVPGSAINNGDPSGAKYPSGVNNMTDTTTRTINYRYSNGQVAKPSVTQQVTYQRKMVIDKVTGKVLSDSWTPTTGSLPAVTSPVITGYTPSASSIAAENNIPVGNNHQDVTVTYTPDKESITITYHDETTNKNIKVVTESGAYGSSAVNDTNNVIKVLENSGYKLVNSNVPAKLTYTNKAQSYQVNLAHDIKTDSATKTVTRTIKVIYPNGKVQVINQPATFTHTEKVDMVTGKVLSNTITPSNQQLPAFTAPTVSGYTPSMQQVQPLTVTAQSKNTTVTITYQAVSKPASATKVTPASAAKTPVSAAKVTPVSAAKTPASAAKVTPVSAAKAPVSVAKATPVSATQTPASETKVTPVSAVQVPASATKVTPVSAAKVPASETEATPTSATQVPASATEVTPTSAAQTPASTAPTANVAMPTTQAVAQLVPATVRPVYQHVVNHLANSLPSTGDNDDQQLATMGLLVVAIALALVIVDDNKKRN